MKKKNSIDLGLDLMRARATPGQTFTLREMAAWCECTPECLRQIEEGALAKLRKKPALRELARQYGVRVDADADHKAVLLALSRARGVRKV